MRINQVRKGVTLTEVIVGAVILSIAFGGLLATFVAVRKYVNRANKRLIVVNLVTNQFDNLYREVRGDTWDSGALQPGSTNLNSYTIDGLVYQDAGAPNSYSVATVGNYRQVSVTINYP